MSANDYTKDATAKNTVYLQRFATGEARKVDKFLTELQTRILGSMASGDFTTARQQSVLLEIQRLNSEYMLALGEQVALSARDSGIYSAEFTQRLMNKASKVNFIMPDPFAIESQVLMGVMAIKPGVKSITVQEAISQFGKAKSLEINRALTDGIIAGETKDQIVSRVQSVVSISRRQADTLTRTVVNSAANIGRMATFIENDDLLEGYEWVSVLDDRTTLTCAARDGEVYEFKMGNPIPPAHWNCRSQVVAVLLPKYQAKNLKGGRSTESGKITPETTYGEWLKRQSTDFQNEALGPQRAALFRDGGLKIDRFVDTTGKAYSLDQLRMLEPQAFEEAGL